MWNISFQRKVEKAEANSSQSANMWVPWNIFLKAYVDRDNLHAVQSKIFPSKSTQLPNSLLWWNSNTFKTVDIIKTCVAVHIFSRKISDLLRSLSVGTLICRASLIKHLLIISLSSFTSLYNSARRAKSRLRKRNSDRHSSPSKSSQERNHKVRLLDRFKSCKSRSSSWFYNLHCGLSRVISNFFQWSHPDKQTTQNNNVNKLDSTESAVSDDAAWCLWITATTAFSHQSSHRFRRRRRRPRSRCLKSLMSPYIRRLCPQYKWQAKLSCLTKTTL